MWDDEKRKKDDAINAMLLGVVFASLIALIFKLVKGAIRYPVAAGVIILGLYGFYKYNAWQVANAAENVVITVRSGPTGCPENNVRLVIANNSADQSIQSIRISLNAFLANRSNRVVFASHSTDRIIPVGQQANECVEVTRLDGFSSTEQAQMRWETEVVSIQMQ